jgi:hypothetical protein
MEIIKFENEVVIFKIVFAMGPWTTIPKDSKKIPPITSSNYLSLEFGPMILLKC